MNPIIKDIWMTRIALTIWVIAALSLMVLLARMAMGEIGSTASPVAAWEHSSSSGVGRYEIHYGPVPRRTNDPFYERGYTATNVIPRFFTNTALANLSPGIWFLSIIAVGTNGVPSSYSTNEVCYTNRGAAPVSLRLLWTGGNQILQGADTAGGPWTDLAELTNPPVQLSLQQKQMFRLKMLTNLPPVPR